MSGEAMTPQEIEAAIERGDTDVINNLLSGELPTAEVEVGEVVEEEVQEVVEESSSPTVEDETVTEQTLSEDEEIAEKYRLELEATKAKQAEKERLLDQKYAELKKEADKKEAERLKLAAQLKEKEEREKEEARKAFEIREDEDDVELAGTFSKNNRELIKQLKDDVSNVADSSTVQALLDRINALEGTEAQRRAEQESIAAQNAEKDRMKKLYSEVEGFQKEFTHFTTEKPIGEMHAEHDLFRERISKTIGTDESSEVNKAVRGVLNGDKRYAKLKDQLETGGVDIPTGADKFFQLSEIVDLKNGYKYNEITGGYDEITDEFGNHVVQRSISDAYKLSNYSENISEAKKSQSKEIQRILDNREESATTIPNDMVSDSVDGTALTNDEISVLLDTPSSAIKSNPELAKRLKQAYAQMGIKS